MRTPAQRGRYGRWLVAAREARGFDTAEKALAALAAAGITIGRSTYAEYESGAKTPSRNHLPRLVEFWGEVPAEDAVAPAGQAELVAALREQTAAISELAAQVRALAEGRDEEIVNAVSGAVALAVRTTLQAAGIADGPPRR